jgi:hypothetical protein
LGRVHPERIDILLASELDDAQQGQRLVGAARNRRENDREESSEGSHADQGG